MCVLWYACMYVRAAAESTGTNTAASAVRLGGGGAPGWGVHEREMEIPRLG